MVACFEPDPDKMEPAQKHGIRIAIDVRHVNKSVVMLSAILMEFRGGEPSRIVWAIQGVEEWRTT